MIRLLFIFLLVLETVSGAYTEAAPMAESDATPTTLVVFGATGDLSSKKIFPAIEKLAEKKQLPGSLALVGVARKTEEIFQKQIKLTYPLQYSQTDFDGEYKGLADLLGRIDRDFGKKSRKIYFLAIQPSYFHTVVERLTEKGLIGPDDRVIIEKPFGTDLTSALVLQKNLEQHLKEEQIYRIDHYLGKEGVINLTHFRLNHELEEIWNKDHIQEVSLTLSEQIGIGSRAQFWEETGMLRDVVQNHMMQLLSLFAMERGQVSVEKVNLLNAIRPIEVETVVRGQYGPGVIREEAVVGYKEEAGVLAASKAETYFAATLYIDNNRWEGVPFHIQAGKRLAEQLTEIAVHFKSGDVLHLRIQPKPAFYFEGSEPISFEPHVYSEAYQKLIMDALVGDRSSFVKNEELLAAWRLFTPVLEYWEEGGEMHTYSAGSLGVFRK